MCTCGTRRCSSDSTWMKPPFCVDYPVDRGQTKAGALAGVFGGEERLEQVLQRLGRHAGAVVADRQAYVVAGRAAFMLRAVLVVQSDVAPSG